MPKYNVRIHSKAPKLVFNVTAKSEKEAVIKAMELANESYNSSFYDNKWQIKVTKDANPIN